MSFYSGEPVREVHDDEPHDRALQGCLLGLDHLQPDDSAIVVVAQECGAARSALFVIRLVINIGMWLERFVIIVISLQRDFIPWQMGHVLPHALGLGDAGRIVRLVLCCCSISSFASCPMISMVEMRTLVHQTERRESRMHK